MTLFICAAAHFLVDAVCAATLFGAGLSAGELATAVLVYNTLAFATQCAVGLLTDRAGRLGLFTAAACFLTALGFALDLPDMVRVVMVGVGNSFFHVGAGSVILLQSGGRAGKLGVFVAPGAIGLAMGTLWPRLGGYLALALAAAGVLVLALDRRVSPGKFRWGYAYREIASAQLPAMPRAVPFGGGEARVGLALPLLVAVAARAFGGVALSFPWKTGAAFALITSVVVAGGKALGGFLTDRLGPRKAALATIPAAALLLALGSEFMPSSLLGLLLLNMTMPLTLLLIYRALPGEPGLAFGLAASALWPGHLAGQLLTLESPMAQLVTALCLLAGLAAILISLKKTETESLK